MAGWVSEICEPLLTSVRVMKAPESSWLGSMARLKATVIRVSGATFVEPSAGKMESRCGGVESSVTGLAGTTPEPYGRARLCNAPMVLSSGPR